MSVALYWKTKTVSTSWSFPHLFPERCQGVAWFPAWKTAQYDGDFLLCCVLCVQSELFYLGAILENSLREDTFSPTFPPWNLRNSVSPLWIPEHLEQLDSRFERLNKPMDSNIGFEILLMTRLVRPFVDDDKTMTRHLQYTFVFPTHCIALSSGAMFEKQIWSQVKFYSLVLQNAALRVICPCKTVQTCFLIS